MPNITTNHAITYTNIIHQLFVSIGEACPIKIINNKYSMLPSIRTLKTKAQFLRRCHSDMGIPAFWASPFPYP